MVDKNYFYKYAEGTYRQALSVLKNSNCDVNGNCICKGERCLNGFFVDYKSKEFEPSISRGKKGYFLKIPYKGVGNYNSIKKAIMKSLNIK